MQIVGSITSVVELNEWSGWIESWAWDEMFFSVWERCLPNFCLSIFFFLSKVFLRCDAFENKYLNFRFSRFIEFMSRNIKYSEVAMDSLPCRDVRATV